MEERTLLILKPDCLQKLLAGETLRYFNKAGLHVIACKKMQLTDAILRDHYAHIAHLPFFPEIAEFMKSYPVMIVAMAGPNAVNAARAALGPTDPKLAEKGTVRGDYGTDKMRNVCHASDSKEAAEIEIKRFFNEDEIF